MELKKNDLKSLCRDVVQLSRETGIWIKKEMRKVSRKDVETKGLHDFVTYVDKGAEERLTKKLAQLLPEAGFLVEENTISRRGNEYTWIVDPLDGTTNFIHGIPCFSISIALVKMDRPVLGVVYEINSNEAFYSWEGGKAYKNNRIIKVSKAENLNDSLIATGFPYYDYSRLDEYFVLFEHFLRNTRGVRRLGSAAVDLAYVACGRFDGFFEYSLNPWDVAAGAFLVKQAGGRVADFSGSDNYIFGKEIVATNSLLYDEFIDIVKRSMGQEG